MRWLVTTLSNSNFVNPVDATLAAEYSQSRQALSKDHSDLLALTDLVHTSAQGGLCEWLDCQVCGLDAFEEP
jgi:hypothetical protein